MNRAASFLLLTLPLQVACSNGMNSAPQGTDGVSCRAFGGISQRVCPTSMLKLNTNPERYVGRVVAVSGFVVEEDGSYFIYPNRAFYSAGDKESACVVAGPGIVKDHVLSQITVIGNFSTRDVTEDNLLNPRCSIAPILIRGQSANKD